MPTTRALPVAPFAHDKIEDMDANEDIKYCPVCDDTFSSYEDMLSIIKKQMCSFCWKETAPKEKKVIVAEVKEAQIEADKSSTEDVHSKEDVVQAPIGRKSWTVPRYKLQAPYQWGIKRGKEMEKKRYIYLLEHYDEELIGLPFTQENVVAYLSSLP